MTKKKLIAVILAFACLATTQTKATVTINLDMGFFYDQYTNIVASNAIALLVADTSGLGLAGLTNLAWNSSLTVGAPLTLESGMTTNLILGKWNIKDTSTYDGYLMNAVNSLLLTPPLATGEGLYIMWFPTLTLTSSQPGVGTYYGVYRDTNSVPLDGAQPWVIPNDGSTVTLQAFTPDIEGGNTPISSLLAKYQTIPEPSAFALVGLGLAGMLVLRRRRRS